ncbi:3-hydroxyacyl-CoA dehydrogenase family protein [Microtetraspora sp. NBRC 16547]|uniref:3-hydroxyacyl-CoA dehydrogenase family protein n=1 Tax=Microtetraspora sp. NBRC 16547 TaxID=3030993 RepID=UPI0024A176A8|nr:3-hydroxyacyl-CoA dehydrogenase family protein [Microtetraspora sp. NBRC 16547]GLW98511.1 3-hydroxyacyl-CoA dehydrogenase [Microtetraspora sp. NBRC 16547]
MTDADSTGAVTGSPRLPVRCGVVGGGRMGAGIAHALLLAGCDVTLVERDAQSVTAARGRVERAVEGSAKRGQVDDAGTVMARLAAVADYGDLAGSGLVVEAVPEDLDLKLVTLRAVEDAVSPDAVIASNTSSISLDTLAQALARPERLLGFHFFNPVPASKLVEVVIAGATDPALRARAVAWVEQIKKTAVVVKDAPGFASSRLGVALGLEAIRMVEAGVASAADIDAAMTLGYGHPTGPLRLTDLVGLDVRLGIARYLERELGPRFAPPKLLVELVEQGHLGRKTGKGFYDWSEDQA